MGTPWGVAGAWGSQALSAPWKLCTACGFTFEWRGHWRRLLLSAEGGHCRTPRAHLAPGGARAGACSAGRSPRALAAAGEALPRRRGARSGARTAIGSRLPALSPRAPARRGGAAPRVPPALTPSPSSLQGRLGQHHVLASCRPRGDGHGALPHGVRPLSQTRYRLPCPGPAAVCVRRVSPVLAELGPPGPCELGQVAAGA